MAKQAPASPSPSPAVDNEDDENDVDGGSTDEEIIEIAKRRFKIAEDANIDHRIEALEDMKFLAGDQWDDKTKAQRTEDSRPCLTINRLPQFLKQVTNDQRQNRQSIKVNPVDNKATIETAKIYQGLIRHIEYDSNADVAYDTAFEGSAGPGLGFYRILTDWCDPMSFNQKLVIRQVEDPNSIYLDPHFQQPDGSDANWGFVFDDMPKDDFRAQNPGSKIVTENWEVRNEEGWVTESSVRVAEYFYKTFEKTSICLLSNGDVVKKADVQKAIAGSAAQDSGPLKIIKERVTILPAIKWVKLSSAEILDKREWPGQWIPIIPVIGDKLVISGKKIYQGIIRNAKDPQKMYNYWNSAATETIALAPKAPFIAAEGQLEGHEDEWDQANIKSFSVLEYVPRTLNGQPVPPPARQVYEPPIQAMSTLMMHAADDMKATTGIYDTSLGNRSNEHSGVAIQRRNMQSQTANFHFVDNLSRSIRHGGRILIDLIPHIYDVPSAQRILGEDGKPEIVLLNQIFQDKQTGKDTIHKMDYGTYDCTVSTGPNYATKRQEAAASMMDFAKSFPAAANVISDLIARNMDWQDADQIADRLEGVLPPGVLKNKDGNQQQPLPPEAQQKMSQMGQLIDQLTAQLKHKTQQIETKTLELESKERIEMAKLKVEAEIALATLDQKDGVIALQHEVETIKIRMAQIGANEPIEEGNEPPAGNPAAPADPNQPPTGGPSPGQPME